MRVLLILVEEGWIGGIWMALLLVVAAADLASVGDSGGVSWFSEVLVVVLDSSTCCGEEQVVGWMSSSMVTRVAWNFVFSCGQGSW